VDNPESKARPYGLFAPALRRAGTLTRSRMPGFSWTIAERVLTGDLDDPAQTSLIGRVALRAVGGLGRLAGGPGHQYR